MANSLGIYVNDDVVRFAKVTSENGKNVKLEQYGVRYVKTSSKDTIETIIEETNSQSSQIAINPYNDINLNIQMFEQIQDKNYVSDVVKMEFEAWCEKNAKSPERYSYVYKVSDLKGSDNKKTGIINFTEKKYIDEITQYASNNISSIYPPEFLLYRLVEDEEQNFLLVDLDDTLTIMTVLGGKIAEIKSYSIGMKQILDDFKLKLGTSQKAYEACKQLNVYSDGSPTNNNKELEAITEPILQEVLRNVLANLNVHKIDLTKVFITGTGILFTNIDILFTEFLEMKCDILKPVFIEDTSNVRNMAEILETTQAIALAYDMVVPHAKEVEYISKKIKMKNQFSNMFLGTKVKNNKSNSTKQKSEKSDINEVSKKEKVPFIFSTDKYTVGLICASIVSVLIFITYLTFTSIYATKLTNMTTTVNNNTNKLKAKTQEVSSDVQYIQTNSKKYKDINDRVKTIVEQIESNKIGKFTTYNVATFLQSVVKIIPKNVKLNSISSDDNKKVTIVAESNSYADLGYFVAQLKLNNTLNSVKINSIKNGDITVIEIGGELP